MKTTVYSIYYNGAFQGTITATSCYEAIERFMSRDRAKYTDRRLMRATWRK